MVCPVVPALDGNGLAMRGGTFLDAAASAGDVDLLVVPMVPARPQDALFARSRSHRLMMVETAGRVDTWCELISRSADEVERLSMLKRYGLPRICGFLSAPVIRDACDFIAGNRYDLTIIQRSYTGLLIEHIKRRTTTGPVMVDLDDDDAAVSRYLASRSEPDHGGGNSQVHEFEADAYDALLSRVAGIAGVTTMANEDAIDAVVNRLDIPVPVHVTNCIDVKDKVEPADMPELIVVGTLNYEPNVEGILWLLRHVLPKIRKQIPDVRLTIAGRKPVKLIRDIANEMDVKLISDAEDLSILYAGSMLVLVPILSGSGTRIKVLEAGSYGLPIVSTVKGGEGLGLEDGRHGWFTEANGDDFASACLAALRSPAERAKRALQLREHVQRLYERKEVVEQISFLITAQLSEVVNLTEVDEG